MSRLNRLSCSAVKLTIDWHRKSNERARGHGRRRRVAVTEALSRADDGACCWAESVDVALALC